VVQQGQVRPRGRHPVEAGVAQHPQVCLGGPGGLVAGQRPGGEQVDQRGVGHQQPVQGQAHRAQPVGPVAAGGAAVEVAQDVVTHGVEQLVLAGEVGVQRHRADTQPVGQRAHRQRGGPALVQHRDGAVQDRAPAEAAAWRAGAPSVRGHLTSPARDAVHRGQGLPER
jgi:hypothetical protein